MVIYSSPWFAPHYAFFPFLYCTSSTVYIPIKSTTMGVVRTVIQKGTGVLPKAGDTITVHCTGFLADGKKKFWSTKDTNEPFSFKVGLGQVIKGWDEGMIQMSVGERAELLMTGDYAYGERGFPAWGIPPNASLLFDIELLKIN
ncbi:peptidylprolyl isomerase [Angomonas deanei]|uniref:peptidylprolyl isomerase n=1 Tax=Angomonas deanei TaxID=59799 RepID=S9UK52_9TRYP|nr:peptidylprolyl isomerase [Angomonas deanei]EPY41746.1 peptidylprolyl isomerase [Angomonas deanei]CAD2216585.1 FKBP-type peptidyl-prolyl cis-trans isomerase, putative [Angomonas deanei]|eukprot:EPY29139.1 peptidylprolyl isomerase [Angomonas deanei]